MFLNPGYARAFNSDFAISYPGSIPNMPATILLDIEVLGAGGCYPKLMSDLVLANDTVFGIYVVAKSSGTTGGSLDPAVNVSAVIATGDNFLPAGYDVFRRVGLCYIDSGTNQLIKWIQSGVATERQYTLQDPVIAVSGGTATVDTVLDLTDGDGVVPPGHANYCELSVSLLPTVAGQYVSIAPTVLNAVGLPPVTLVGPAAALISWTSEIVCGIIGPVTEHGNAAIKYKVSNAAATAGIAVASFTDSLGNDLF
jgi:hypothetical protein